MKLAFNKEARYPDYEEGYELYSSRTRSRTRIARKLYKKVIREYCKMSADRLVEQGMIDLPFGLGTISASIFRRRPQYRGKKFIGYGKMDWNKGYYDGEPKSFGLVFLPNRKKNQNLRCFGFVANRQLFKRVKAQYESEDCSWVPMEFDNEMI